MTLRTTLLSVALAGTVALPVAAKELKFASFTAPQHTITYSVIEKLNEILTEATDGDVTVRGYYGGELGAGPAEQYVRVVQGVADLSWGLPGYTSSQFGKTMIAELPAAVPPGMTGYEVLWNAFDGYLKPEFPAATPVALWTSEPNILIMKDHDIRTPADLAGLKVRVAGSTAADVASALGATPVQMPMTEVYNALQTGLIDGVITGASTLSDFRLDEVANSYTLGVPLGRLTMFTIMSQKSYDGLSDVAKKAIDDARPVLSKSAEEEWQQTADAAVQAARDAGNNTIIELSSEEAQPFADLVEPVAAKYRTSVNGDETFQAMIGK
ncbi:MAG: TRAP transporter substrate-binding protein [Qingshengfaniella sp.]